ncbi:hypothetical protein FZEAL_7262 [Fusarium zealandicum]|uniref:Zn(2)-C6 fungal-type domain-containing protein n=1 Tax=Fusarium zealandicum TaxID=1053134 RepID=A0A8H4UG38_9HYPO|nr:hypothetical protein FZEAL_7262 [Fusarium zealandicum]
MPVVPDPRRGRACDACHANKTKCNGGTKCALCVKRGINCTYKLVGKNETDSNGSRNNAAASDSSDSPSPVPRDVELQDSVAAAAVAANGGRQRLSLAEAAWLGLRRISQRLSCREISIENDGQLLEGDKGWMEPATDEYLGRFHDTWPILHGPTITSMHQPTILTISVIMIGSWLKNPDDLREPVLRIHEILVDRFFEWLVHPRPRHQIDKPWPVETFQAIVLNIIFAFYHGSEKLVAKAFLLRGMLITAMRDMEFFVCESAAYEQRVHFPGTFIPWLQTIRERWKRLIVALYKIDVYLSIVHGQPPALHREEIDTTMSSTYCLWNAYGLNIFFRRLSQEPTDRVGFKLSEVISDPNSPAKPLVLLEDVQLAFCGLFPAIWNDTQIVRRSTEVGRPTMNSLTSLAWQLETWKADLERIAHQCSQGFHAGDTEGFPFAAYIGKWDEDPPRARSTAMMNIKCLVSDCRMTYHLQGLHLYADTRVISTVARFTRLAADDETSSSLRIQKHQSQLNAWATTSESRRALLHAIAVLCEREADIEANEPQALSADPIAYLAISMSALVFWAWHAFSEVACICVPNLSHINIGVDPIDMRSTARLESWIQSGGTAAIQGIPVCRCVADGWMARFNALLPQGSRRWELSDDVAPVLQPLRAGR